MTTLELCASTRFRRARRAVLATALWLFSISTTVLLAGMWGRAVASDNGAIEAGARAALESDVVSGLLTGWIADGIASAAVDLPQGTALSAATAVWEHPETTNVLAAAVDELVAAALPPPGTSVSVDLATALRPLSSVVIVELEARGVALTSSTIDAALAEIPEVVVGSVTESGLAGAVAETRSALMKVGAVRSRRNVAERRRGCRRCPGSVPTAEGARHQGCAVCTDVCDPASAWRLGARSAGWKVTPRRRGLGTSLQQLSCAAGDRVCGLRCCCRSDCNREPVSAFTRRLSRPGARATLFAHA